MGCSIGRFQCGCSGGDIADDAYLERDIRCGSLLNFVYKMAFLASENAVFLNSLSDGRKYAKFEQVLNRLKTKHLRFPDILLVSQKRLFTLQREPYDVPTRVLSPGH